MADVELRWCDGMCAQAGSCGRKVYAPGNSFGADLASRCLGVPVVNSSPTTELWLKTVCLLFRLVWCISCLLNSCSSNNTLCISLETDLVLWFSHGCQGFFATKIYSFDLTTGIPEYFHKPAINVRHHTPNECYTERVPS